MPYETFVIEAAAATQVLVHWESCPRLQGSETHATEPARADSDTEPGLRARTTITRPPAQRQASAEHSMRVGREL